MKRTYRHILFALALLAMVSCSREQELDDDAAVRFTVTAAQNDGPESRTSYGTLSGSRQNILWTAGDRIVIWSPDAVNENSGLFTHPALSYTINGQSSGSSSGQATGITPVTSGTRFYWGEAPTHVFYGKYPDPAWSAAAPHSHTAFASQDPKSSHFKCYLPASTTVTPSSGTYTYTQDMRWCYMTAYASVSRLSAVNLDFIPAVSTFKFTISNSSATALSVSKVKLSSASHRLNGDFSVDISATRGFSVPESSLASADKSVSLQFSSSLSVPTGSSLEVTLFTCPVTANDLTLTLTTASGDMSLDLKDSGDTWFSYPAGNYCNVTCTAIEGNELSPSIILVSTSGQTNTNVTAGGAWELDLPCFTINADGGRVILAPGNLQYIGSAATPYWKFADNQWDCLGTTTGQNSSATNVDRDLFGWATSGYNNKYPYMTSTTATDYGPAISSGEWTANSPEWDWGVHNTISNGGSYSWRTLSTAEWVYLCNSRSCSPRYAQAKVADVPGLILFPDKYIHPSGVAAINNADGDVSGYSDNTFDATAWSALERAGCVFLPAAGSRAGTNVSNVGESGCYWSSHASSRNYAGHLYFYGGYVYPSTGIYRSRGYSVRLVRDFNGSAQQETTYNMSISGSGVSGGAPYTLTMEGSGAGMSKAVTLTSTMRAGGVVSGTPWTAEYSSNGSSWSNTSPLSGFSVTASGDGSISGETVSVNMPSGFVDATVYVRFSNAGQSAVLQVTRHVMVASYTFTVDVLGSKVTFSPGNLQYVGSASTPYWKFANYQWDYLGTTTGQNSTATNVDRDLFGWGTGNTPNKVSTADGDYTSFTDWGTNAIANGGDYTWRSLTKDEWMYILGNSPWTQATVAGSPGIILFPDGYAGNVPSPNRLDSSYSSHIISAVEWGNYQSLGCVFLPAAGVREGSSVGVVGATASYWSSTAGESNYAYGFATADGGTNGVIVSLSRHAGFSVRLVRNNGPVAREFSVGDGRTVVFSSGNLQLVGANSWKFADNQWECFGTSQSNNHRDLFGWGTGDAPNRVSQSDNDYPYFSDWAINTIANGGNYTWRTLTRNEWIYLLARGSAGLWTQATVAGNPGIILFPDDYAGTVPSPSGFNSSYSSHNISADGWRFYESAGCVFLPAAGVRDGSSASLVGATASYWSSTASGTGYAYAYATSDGGNNAVLIPVNRHGGFSVRLVRDIRVHAFSVSANKKVMFSPGNLQYIGSASTPYWKFADDQWSYLGDNGQGSGTTNVDRDLLGWATSGYNNKYPYMFGQTAPNYGPAISAGEWTSNSSQWDWGLHNTIANGGAYTWRTLTIAEWQYLLSRNNATLWAEATVAGVRGIILFPDGAVNDGSFPLGSSSSYSTYTVSADQWYNFESVGCVFLPAAGLRFESNFMSVGASGMYWSSTAGTIEGDNAYAYYLGFSDNANVGGGSVQRFTGCSVRLVRDL